MAASAREGAGGPRRIAGLDTARAVAIALAMTAHTFIHFGVWDQMAADAVLVVRAFVRSATPTFIILFGMMLEIVYLKMIRRGERQACWTRLLTRAIQCYLLYLAVVAAGVAGGQLAPGEGAKAALFLDKAYFANILKFYSLGLVLGIPLLELRARHGLKAVAAVLAAIWLSYPLIQALPPLPWSARHLGSFLIGAGAETGPSVLQGMSLAALGMFLGHAALGLVGQERTARRRAAMMLATIVLLVALPVGALLLSMGVRPLFAAFTDYATRAANHPVYYLVGSAFAMAMIAACTLVAARLPASVLARLNVFGISSLFAYAFGNVALNLLPSLNGSLATGLAAALAFMLSLYAVTTWFQAAARAGAATGTAERPRGTPAARLARLHEGPRAMTARLAGLLVSGAFALKRGRAA